MIKILVIGCGPHATHYYLPAIMRRMATDCDVRLAGVLDIESQRAFVTEELAVRNIPAKAWFTAPFNGDVLPETTAALFDSLFADGIFNAVIIATDPLHHKCYADWAISRSLPILMDKPVTTRENAALDSVQARGIAEDYDDTLARYLALPEPRPPFILLAHRRYHPGILEVRRIIHEVCAQTGCPVTNIRSAHADGQWRLPHEICHQRHHSYNQGHGKLSHSGFHFVDCATEFWRESLLASRKTADDVEVFSSIVRPDGFQKQISREVYQRLFGKAAYEAACVESESELAMLYKGCGELDAETVMTLRSGGVPFSIASLGLLHDSYSRRAWLVPDRDLYKGNGRVKHEDHSIQVGPFLNVRVQSYQSKDKHDICTAEEDELPGGNNHFELLVFRNERMIGGKSFERFTLRDIPGASSFDPGSLFISQVKDNCLVEWLDAIRNPGTSDSNLLSAFSDHRMGVRLLSAIYRAITSRHDGGSPICVVPWTDR